MRITVLLVVLLGLPAARAAPAEAERALVETVERELLAFVGLAAERGALEACQEELRRALRVTPGSKRLAAELAGVEARRGEEADGVELGPDLDARRAALREAISLGLARAAQAVADDPGAHAHYLSLLQRFYPSPAAYEALGKEYFRPLWRWVSPEVAQALRGGADYYEGRLIDARQVAHLDAKHADWSNPWVLSDGVHEVRTTCPLRQANQALTLARALREHLLTTFGEALDLRAPQGKLPIVMARTHAQFVEQLEAYGWSGEQARTHPKASGVAFYKRSDKPLGPCLLTFEPGNAQGKLFRIPLERFESLQAMLVHELAHQIAFEYSKHGVPRGKTGAPLRPLDAQQWVVEGFATYMGQHAYDGRTWHLRLSTEVPGVVSPTDTGAFASTYGWRQRLPAIAEFVTFPRRSFSKVAGQKIAGTLTYFMLEGAGQRYRAGFLELLKVVHQERATRTTFAEAFADCDTTRLQADWEAFLEELDLD